MVYLWEKFQHGSLKKWSMPFCAFFTTFTFVMALLVLSIDLRGYEHVRFNLSSILDFENTPQDSPRLISLVRRRYLKPPDPGGTAHPQEDLTPVKPPLQLIKILRKKKAGIFIEAGAYSGGVDCGSEWLERKMAWRGLLTQAHPGDYAALLARRRPASHTANVCISPTPYPKHAYFRNSSRGERGGGLARVPCFPLYSLLLAYNTTRIDLLTLNLLSAELQVLKTLLGVKRVRVEVISVVNNSEAGGDTCCSEALALLLQRHSYKPATACPLPPTSICYFLRS